MKVELNTERVQTDMRTGMKLVYLSVMKPNYKQIFLSFFMTHDAFMNTMTTMTIVALERRVRRLLK